MPMTPPIASGLAGRDNFAPMVDAGARLWGFGECGVDEGLGESGGLDGAVDGKRSDEDAALGSSGQGGSGVGEGEVVVDAAEIFLGPGVFDSAAEAAQENGPGEWGQGRGRGVERERLQFGMIDSDKPAGGGNQAGTAAVGEQNSGGMAAGEAGGA
jgi:hypothetical protein